jgi:hypothetical protein
MQEPGLIEAQGMLSFHQHVLSTSKMNWRVNYVLSMSRDSIEVISCGRYGARAGGREPADDARQ